MILKLKQWLSNSTEDTTEVTKEQAIALLLFEAATADYALDDTEISSLLAGLEQGLQISKDEAQTLLQWAQTHSQLSTSLFPFTQCLNKALNFEQKTEVMQLLWRVVFADQVLDKYEEHYMRHIADLLYVPHDTYIETKLAVSRNQ